MNRKIDRRWQFRIGLSINTHGRRELHLALELFIEHGSVVFTLQHCGHWKLLIGLQEMVVDCHMSLDLPIEPP